MKKTKYILIFLTAACLLCGGCGENTSDNFNDLKELSEKDDSDKSNDSKTNEIDTSDTFVMDKKNREGFMKEGDSQTELPNGYTGIYSVDDLQNMGNNKKYILMADLDMSQVTWTSKTLEECTFDGNYHKISGLKTCLLDSFKNGDVENLYLENVDLEDAALVKFMFSGTIKNCYVTGNVKGCAGLVSTACPSNGMGTSVNIQYCYNAASIVNENNCDVDSTGGIVGSIDLENNGNGVKVDINISNCENFGEIKGCRDTGGIIGEMRRASLSGNYYEALIDCTILNCFNYGIISGYRYAGGILGEFYAVNASKAVENNYAISRCANFNEITVSEEGNFKCAGGICGSIGLRANENYNSIVEMEVSDCLNTADITTINKDGDSGEGYGICGEVELEYGTCRINRCINIGNKSDCTYQDDFGYSQPVYECNDYYTTKSMSISEMKDITANLQNFDYPLTWGINELYSGFPHPYGDDEYESVMNYYNAKRRENASNMVDESDASDIILMQRYSDMLASISLGGYRPEDTERKNQNSSLIEYSGNPNNYYAIADVDNDKTKELIIKFFDDELVIYSYDLEKNEIKKEANEPSAQDWESSYKGSDKIEWIALKSENYSVYTEAYTTYYLDLIKKDIASDSDIGLMYIEQQDIVDILTSKYNITFEELYEGMEDEGKYEGVVVCSVIHEDGMSVSYENEQVGNLTLLGLYPGMTEKEAGKILEKYGFIKDTSNIDSINISYYTGGGFRNYFITLKVENDKLISISIYKGSKYIG